jgi:hypothetical protein
VGSRVLDIGSGVGKFCMVGACCTDGYFVGVEKRDYFVEISKKIAKSYNIKNVNFINSNITEINYSSYDGFYFFNSFYENIALSGHIDQEGVGDLHLYKRYSAYTYNQFYSLLNGARLVAYCTDSEIVPTSFQLVYCLQGGLIKFWQKNCKMAIVG